MEIRSFSIKYASEKKKKIGGNKITLSKELIRLENEGMEDSDEYKNKFQELEKIYDYEVKGELMRLR